MAVMLIADDDPISRQTLAAILCGEGHEIIQANDGIEALRHLTARDPDVLLTDIFMPGKSGLDVIREIKAERRALPIIAFSGGSAFASFEQLRWAESYGVAATLKKPFQRLDVIEIVSRVIREKFFFR